MTDLDSLNLPLTIGRYQILSLLGSGAMGSVVLAEDPRIKRKVAIKLMKLDAVKTEADRHEYLARFEREAEVSGLLNHPGIVAIYDVGEVEGQGPFLAMEFVAGRPLDGILKNGPALTLKEKLRIAVGVAEALDHAHAKAVVHRDVKPGNVMVGEDGRPKLMDFGIAKREDGSLTQTGTFLGTPSYASPEQIKEGRVDSRSDIFSFGVLAFELMSGQSPFPGASINTILYRIVNEPPVEVQPPVLGILPEGWRRVFSRVLSKLPEARHATCLAFVRDLLDAVEDLSQEDRRELLNLMRVSVEGVLPEIVSTSFDETLVVAREPRRSGWPWIAAAALAVLAGGGWLLLKNPRGTRVQIDSLPKGARVFVKNLEVGTTPMNQPLLPGDKLRLELKGYQPRDFEFRPGAATTPFQLQPIISEELLDSLPQGATVVLDDQKLEGATPLKVSWNQGRAHRLTLTTADHLQFNHEYEPGETPGGQVLSLEAATTAGTREEPPLDRNAPGLLRLAGDYAVSVVADGKDWGRLSPGAKLPLPPGIHRLDLANAEVFYRESRTVTLTAGKEASLAVPGLATLTVGTFPGIGKVFVDGRDAGIESDGSPVKVTLGRHTITVRGARSASKPETLDVHGDKALNIPL